MGRALYDPIGLLLCSLLAQALMLVFGGGTAGGTAGDCSCWNTLRISAASPFGCQDARTQGRSTLTTTPGGLSPAAAVLRSNVIFCREHTMPPITVSSFQCPFSSAGPFRGHRFVLNCAYFFDDGETVDLQEYTDNPYQMHNATWAGPSNLGQSV